MDEGVEPRPIRRRQALPFKAGKKAPLRANPEQAQAFRPGSRGVDLANGFKLGHI
jgi:hypothetical protein